MHVPERVLILIPYLTFVIVGLAGGLLNVAWTYMQADFRVSLDALGIVLAAVTVGATLGTVASGTVIGRFGIARVALGASLLACAGLVAVAFSPLWLLLLLAMVIASLGRGALDAGMNNFVSANYGASEMNWLHASWGLGLTIGPTFVTFFVLTLGQSWRMAYAAVGLLILLITLLILLTWSQWTLQEDAATEDMPQAPLPSNRATVRETLQQPKVLASMALFFVYAGVELGTGQLAFTLLTQSRQIPPETASVWVSLYWGSFTIGRMLIGLLALRLGEMVLIRLSMLVMLIGAVVLMLSSGDASFVGLILLGFGLSAQFPLFVSQIPQRVGKRYASQAIGFLIGTAILGATVLTGLYGFIANRTTLEMIAVLIVINALVVIGTYQLILYMDARNERKRKVHA